MLIKLWVSPTFLFANSVAFSPNILPCVTRVFLKNSEGSGKVGSFDGGMAERLGRGLQILVHRFDSGYHLQIQISVAFWKLQLPSESVTCLMHAPSSLSRWISKLLGSFRWRDGGNRNRTEGEIWVTTSNFKSPSLFENSNFGSFLPWYGWVVLYTFS